MTSGKLISLAFFLLILGVVIGSQLLSGDDARYQVMEKRLDSLRYLNNKMVTFDSIQSASQKRFLDSLSSIKTTLEYERAQRTKENKLLRKRNQDLENRFNSISIPDRPEF